MAKTETEGEPPLSKTGPPKTRKADPSKTKKTDPSKTKKTDPSKTKSKVIVSTNSSSRVQLGLILVAGLYLTTLWLDGIGSNLPAKATPRVWLYFAQVAALFKNAGLAAIDYRAEGWSCADRRWVEIDVRPYFLIDADTKENRFHRAMMFYRRERKVLNALDDYVVRRENATASSSDLVLPVGRPAFGGTSGRPRIGGVRFSSLRIPYPERGARVERRERAPLASYAPELRHAWYWTRSSRRYDRCGDRPPASKKSDDDEPSSSPIPDGDRDGQP